MRELSQRDPMNHIIYFGTSRVLYLVMLYRVPHHKKQLIMKKQKDCKRIMVN